MMRLKKKSGNSSKSKSVKKKTEKSDEEVKIKSPKKPVVSESRTAPNNIEKIKEDINKPIQEPKRVLKL